MSTPKISGETDGIRLPSAQEICIGTSLYAPLKLEDTGPNHVRLHSFITEEFQIDCYCPWCGQPTVLLLEGMALELESHEFEFWDRVFSKNAVCSRKYQHEFYFHFRLESKVLSKIGQSPSMADLEQANILRYRSILDDEHFKELTRAIGLSAHGVGIGSFVYLRRIFERLIEEASLKARETEGWDQEEFSKSRMDEKIAIVRNELPPFLVEQRGLYKILSSGIHNLDEETCLSYFPVVLTGIELILDQKFALDEQARKMARAQKEIGQIQGKLKKG